MRARRAKGVAMRSGDREAREAARQQVEQAKTALGERGEPWWTGGAKDWNRYMAKNTPYAEWLDSLAASETAAKL